MTWDDFASTCCVEQILEIYLYVSQSFSARILSYFLRVLDQVEEPDVTKKVPNLDQTLMLLRLSFSTLVFLVRHSGLLDSFFYLCNIDLERIEGK